MYRFIVSNDGTVANAKYIEALENNPELLKNYYDMEFDDIATFLFREDMNQELYDNICMALTCSDNLKYPMLRNDAQLLFFGAYCNYAYMNNESSIEIVSLPQLKNVYSSCNGNFNVLNKTQGSKRVVRFITIEPKTTYLFFGCDVEFKIPVSFYQDTELGVKGCCIAAESKNPYAMVSIPCLGIKNAKLPKHLYLRFFRNYVLENNTLSVTEDMHNMEPSDAIKLMFDKDDEVLFIDMLEFIGLELAYKFRKSDDTIYYWSTDDNALIAELQTPNSSVIYTSDGYEDELTYWTQLTYSTYRLFNTGSEYLPINNTNTISIWR